MAITEGDQMEPTTGPAAGDPNDGRVPTSHERMTGQPWDASYDDGPAPWDVERPQPALVRLAERVHLAGPVLDAGCGSGENARYLASLGLAVLGVDVAPTAIDRARVAAAGLDLDVTFEVADALALDRLGRRFATVVDCGLFHTFDAAERGAYAGALARVTDPGGSLHILCFSDQGADAGPHPVPREAFDEVFGPAAGWRVVAVEPERVLTRFHGPDGAPGWLATVERAGARV